MYPRPTISTVYHFEHIAPRHGTEGTSGFINTLKTLAISKNGNAVSLPMFRCCPDQWSERGGGIEGMKPASCKAGPGKSI